MPRRLPRDQGPRAAITPPTPPNISRSDEAPANISRRRDEETHGGGQVRYYYLVSCVYLLFCHAIDEVILHICCCPCLKPCLATPDELLNPRNRRRKVFTFCVKQLSSLWASYLLLLVARWAFLRPSDVKPMLGACTVNQFQLHWRPPAAAHAAVASRPHLRFNLTTHLLFKNTHQYYRIGYDYPSAAVSYAGQKIGPVDDDHIQAFRQRPLRSSVVDQLVVGVLRNASATVVDTFTAHMMKGRFEMVVRVRVTLSYKYWPLNDNYFTFYDCPLSTPVPKTGEPVRSTPAYCTTVKI